ncbi:MAG TPA: GNAT family N-acetyltransferase [Tepidisphaeraceae bacterium]|nr:GNAT family N-acetyltransferase [Tepidisphaeraceae bacterium]
MDLLIRMARLEDAAALVDFNARMALETEKLTLDRATLQAGVRTALTDPAKGRYFVAEVDRRVIGQLLITHEWSDWRNADLWWIQSVYVHPDYRRRGVFRSLYRYVEDLARRSGVALLRLYVYESNDIGQATYRGLGMRLSHYRVMEQAL